MPTCLRSVADGNCQFRALSFGLYGEWAVLVCVGRWVGGWVGVVARACVLTHVCAHVCVRTRWGQAGGRAGVV